MSAGTGAHRHKVAHSAHGLDPATRTGFRQSSVTVLAARVPAAIYYITMSATGRRRPAQGSVQGPVQGPVQFALIDVVLRSLGLLCLDCLQ